MRTSSCFTPRSHAIRSTASALVARFATHVAHQSGQTLVLFAIGGTGFIALLSLAIDAGLVVYTRTDLQKSADAAAFAAAQDLPSTSQALATAMQYVDENSDPQTDAVVTFQSQGSEPDTVTVQTSREVNFLFARLVGMNSATVNATATVQVAYYNGGRGLVPWGLIASNESNSKLLQNSCFDGWDSSGDPKFKQNMLCTLKYGAGSSSGGDFGALSLGGSGGSLYRQNIAKGNNDPFKKGDRVPSETGNMQGPTRQGITDRFAEPVPSGCAGHDRDDVLQQNDDGSVSIRAGCEDSPRIIVIPVVDKIENPQMSTILGFAFMYLHGQTNSGGQTGVIAEFVYFTTAIPGGIYDANGSGAQMIKLIE